MCINGPHLTKSMARNSPSYRHLKYDDTTRTRVILFCWNLKWSLIKIFQISFFSVSLRFPNQEIGDRAYHHFGAAKAPDSSSSSPFSFVVFFFKLAWFFFSFDINLLMSIQLTDFQELHILIPILFVSLLWQNQSFSFTVGTEKTKYY